MPLSHLNESAACAEARSNLSPGFYEHYRGPASRPYGAYLDMVTFWVCTAFYILGLIVFTLTKRFLIPVSSPYHRYMAVRDSSSIVAQHIGGIYLLGASSYLTIFDFGVFPCWYVYLGPMVIPLIALPVALRLFKFYRGLRISEISSATAATLVEASGDNLQSLTNTSNIGFTATNVAKALFLPLIPKRWASSSDNIELQIVLLRAVSTRSATTVLLILVLTPFALMTLIIAATSPLVLNGCATCLLADIPSVRNGMYSSAVISVLAMAYALWLLRKAKDPLYLIMEAKVGVCLFGIPSAVFFVISGYFSRNGDFTWRFVYNPLLLLTCLCSSLIPAILALYWHFTKQLRNSAMQRRTAKQIGQTSSDENERKMYEGTRENFERILSDPVIHLALHDHMAAEHTLESLLFYDAIIKFEREFHDLPLRTMQIRAKKLVSLFVGDDAVFPVNIPYSMIISLKNTVGLLASVTLSSGVVQIQEADLENAPKRQIDIGFFDEVKREVFDLMRHDGLYRFMASKRYKELVAEYLRSEASKTLASTSSAASTTIASIATRSIRLAKSPFNSSNSSNSLIPRSNPAS